MARSSTTVVKGQKLALKHGLYSASNRLALQNRVIEEARRRLMEGKLTPLEAEARRLLEETIAAQIEITTWLKANGRITPRGKIKDACNLEDKYLRSAASQVKALWGMMLATSEDSAVPEAQDYFARYAPQPTALPPNADVRPNASPIP